MRNKLVELLDIVNKECLQAERRYKDANESALEIAKSSSLSPSQSGDRFHSQGASDLAREKLETVKKLKKEIEKALNKEIPNVVEPPCFLKIDSRVFYLVDNVMLLKGVKLVSSKSTLGQELIGKKLEEIE